MRKLLRKQGFAPETLVTDRVCSYASAKTQLGLSARHEQGLRKKELQLAQQGGTQRGALCRSLESASPIDPEARAGLPFDYPAAGIGDAAARSLRRVGFHDSMGCSMKFQER
jgi:hypothetical protein